MSVSRPNLGGQRRRAIDELDALRRGRVVEHSGTTRLEQLLVRALYEIGYEWAEEQDIARLCSALACDLGKSDADQLRHLLESEHADRYA